MAEKKQDDQLEYTYNSYVRIRDVVDERLGEVAREGQGYPCKRHDTMMMNLLSILFRWSTGPFEWDTQWDSNSHSKIR